ncbi:MAG: REP-associated tyrosine transposase, partial [Rikenellaceae bacterium]|nr:REP-associated tyrosine transposase [Rikenellaceae bacterium]MDN5355920.1 REP-associated tyrosine transposase [Rikenellaceae bacterium]
RGYKIGVTKYFRENTDIFNVWQRNYYEHIIRDTNDLSRIRHYIMDNPKNWNNDEYNINQL